VSEAARTVSVMTVRAANATTPDAIVRYLAAADAQDWPTLADCFTEDGAVRDEGKTHVGRTEIIAWREEVAAAFTWTTTLLGTQATGDDGYSVFMRIEGNFPGGVADLTQRFQMRGGLIAVLDIRP